MKNRHIPKLMLAFLALSMTGCGMAQSEHQENQSAISVQETSSETSAVTSAIPSVDSSIEKQEESSMSLIPEYTPNSTSANPENGASATTIADEPSVQAKPSPSSEPTNAENVGIPSNPDYMLYSPVIAEHYKTAGDYTVYFLYDADNNGILDLVMQSGYTENGKISGWDVYTITNAGAVPMDHIDGSDYPYGLQESQLHLGTQDGDQLIREISQ